MAKPLLGLAALIPVYTEFEFKDYEAKAIFWPFIAWGKGDKRGDFRVLPFMLIIIKMDGMITTHGCCLSIIESSI
jgi:hypothetical protein